MVLLQLYHNHKLGPLGSYVSALLALPPKIFLFLHECHAGGVKETSLQESFKSTVPQHFVKSLLSMLEAQVEPMQLLHVRRPGGRTSAINIVPLAS